MAKAKGDKKSGGRAKGTPNKTGADVRAMARAFTKDAIATLAGIMLDNEAPQQARAMAADKLLDRGWGKAPQTIAGDPENPLRLTVAIDRPPDETREDWIARRHRELGIGAALGAAARPANGRDHG